MSSRRKEKSDRSHVRRSRVEVLDPTPVAIAVGFKPPPTLREQMLALIRSEEFRRHLGSTEHESFEEANDFEIGDDYEPGSPHELQYDHDLGREVLPAEKAFLDSQRRQFDDYVAQEKKKAAIEKRRKAKEKQEVTPPASDPK